LHLEVFGRGGNMCERSGEECDGRDARLDDDDVVPGRAGGIDERLTERAWPGIVVVDDRELGGRRRRRHEAQRRRSQSSDADQ
jgi:hypothetical protein